jgi:ribonuclease HII
VLDLDRIRGRARRELGRLNDSKLVPADVRDELADAILRYAEQVTVVSASCRTIDRDGLHVTNLRLLARALASLEPAPAACLVDGFHLGAGAPPHRRVVGGDRRSAAIAAASVVAKVTRDRLMSGPAAERHPGFGFESHVGYSTPGHRHAVRRLGPSRLHRMSFRSAAYEETEAPIPAVAGRA